MILERNQQDSSTEAALVDCSAGLRGILEGALSGVEVSREEGLRLFEAEGADHDAVLHVADELRRRTVGDDVSFVVTRNINFTNVCYMGCRFCAFSRRREDREAEFLSLEEIAYRAQQAWDRGATEVCIQGGLHPKMKGDHYRKILLAVKQQVPGMHIHAFSPFEIWYGAKLMKMSERDFILDLQAHGLGSMPGTAAEILDVEVRQQLTRDKLSTDQWVSIIRAAHEVGMPTTCTMMYGHVDEPRHWAAHLDLLRGIQKTSRGFTEFVPLGFVHYDAPLYLDGLARPGPTQRENLLVHAVARIMLHGWIDNLQVSWVKMGPAGAQQMLSCGVNDLGGTLMNESISRSAGSPHGQEITPSEMVRIIRTAGRRPVRRNTLYDVLEEFEDHEPQAHSPLVTKAVPNLVR